MMMKRMGAEARYPSQRPIAVVALTALAGPLLRHVAIRAVPRRKQPGIAFRGGAELFTLGPRRCAYLVTADARSDL